MKFEKLLEKYGMSEEQVAEFIAEMKNEKYFLSTEENIDRRYTKLKDDYAASSSELEKARGLIEQLKGEATIGEEMQSKISMYEAEIEKLKIENARERKNNAIKLALLEAKALDIDYLTYKINEKNSELELDEKGNLKGINEIIEGCKQQFPNQFEKEVVEKKIIENKLDKGTGSTAITKDDFKKMSYSERVELYNTNKELYDELNKGE